MSAVSDTAASSIVHFRRRARAGGLLDANDSSSSLSAAAKAKTNLPTIVFYDSTSPALKLEPDPSPGLKPIIKLGPSPSLSPSNYTNGRNGRDGAGQGQSLGKEQKAQKEVQGGAASGQKKKGSGRRPSVARFLTMLDRRQIEQLARFTMVDRRDRKLPATVHKSTSEHTDGYVRKNFIN